jgi:hypothetical protein
MPIENRHERRLQPRRAVRDGIECRLDVHSRVRMVDISANGALLATDLVLPVGSRASLHSKVADTPFSCAIEIRRHADGSLPRPALALGVFFRDMDEHSRRSLEQFLKRASE